MHACIQSFVQHASKERLWDPAREFREKNQSFCYLLLIIDPFSHMGTPDREHGD
jgi:hypothetical protein